jgi:LacI family transcriptional regulator, galactose operon repressor
MSPSIKDIAAECNVTPATVSLALNNHPRISRKRKDEVNAVAKRLGYQPNISAISLRGGKTHSIGILWSLGGPHDSISLIRDISLKLMHNDYVSYIADSLGDPKVIKSCLKDYVARNIDGLIIQLSSDPALEFMRQDDIKSYLKQIGNVVIVNETGTALPRELKYDEIQRQLQPATEEIIDYLITRGRKKIAFLCGSLNSWREERFVECLKERGLAHENCRLINYPANQVIILDSLLKKIYDGSALHYDAVLTHSDEAAVQVINYLLKQGIKIPDDIAVVGFNDSLFSQYFAPPIASVERRSPELASITVDLLIKRIKNKNAVVPKIELPMRFIKRESAG